MFNNICKSWFSSEYAVWYCVVMYSCSCCAEVDGQRYIKSFDVDLMDGVVLACVLTAYIPSLVSCLLSLHNFYY